MGGTRALVAGLLVAACASMAVAQVPADSVPSFARPNGALMRPGALSYTLSLTKAGGQVVPLGTRVVTVTESALGGIPGWLIAESRSGTMIPTTDSVFVTKGDLTPERWVATIGTATLGASFSRDSMYGAIANYQGRFSFQSGVPANALLSAGMMERVVEMLPLAQGYRAAASLLLIDGPTPRAVPAEIAVEREEQVSIGGRMVNCWRVTVRSGAIETRLWVSREGSRVVRTEEATADGLLAGVALQ